MRADVAIIIEDNEKLGVAMVLRTTALKKMKPATLMLTTLDLESSTLQASWSSPHAGHTKLVLSKVYSSKVAHVVLLVVEPQQYWHYLESR